MKCKAFKMFQQVILLNGRNTCLQDYYILVLIREKQQRRKRFKPFINDFFL